MKWMKLKQVFEWTMAVLLDYYGGNDDYMDCGVDGYSDVAREYHQCPVRKNKTTRDTSVSCRPVQKHHLLRKKKGASSLLPSSNPSLLFPSGKAWKIKVAKD